MNLTPIPNQSVNRNHRGNREPHFNRMRMRSKLRTGKFTAKDIADEFGYNADYIRQVAQKMGVKPLRDAAGYGEFLTSLAIGEVAPFDGIGTSDSIKKAANWRGIRIRTWKEDGQIWIARY